MKQRTILLLRALLCIAALNLLSCAKASLLPHKYRLAVSPQPQEVFYSDDGKSTFTINTATTIDVLHVEDLPGAELIARDIKRRFGIIINVRQAPGIAPAASNAICISRISDNIPSNFSPSILAQLDVKKTEGYSLLIKQNRILIRAFDARGAVYGIQTLRQLIRSDSTLPNLAIRDWPEIPARMVYGNYDGPCKSKSDIDRYVDRALLLKYNTIIFESNWYAGGNWWWNYSGERRDLAKYFQQTCQKYHIDFVPLIQGPGWGYGITDQAPMLTEGEWITNEKQQLYNDHPTDLIHTNVVTNDSAPIIVTDLTGKTRYREGTDFIIIPGKTVRPYKQENAPWKLQAAKDGAIKNGQQVLVSYNAVTKETPHQAWNLNDPKVFSLLDRTLDAVQQGLQPSIIHIGHDEIWQIGKDSRDLQSGLTTQQLVRRDLLHWYQRIKKNNSQAHILMWDDLLRPKQSGVTNGILNGVAGDIPKDITIVPWYYYAKEGGADEISSRLKHLATLGFSFIGASSGYFRENSYLWYQALQPYLKTGQAKGMMFTAWDALHAGDMVAAADLMWSGQKVDRQLYTALDAINERVKKQKLVLTADFKLQAPALAKIAAQGVRSGETPKQISDGFTSKVIGDTSLFEQTMGANHWSTLANDAAFSVQEIADLKKLPLLLQAMAHYITADQTKNKQELQNIIQTLHALNFISDEEQNLLLEKSTSAWLSFHEIFGTDIPPA